MTAPVTITPISPTLAGTAFVMVPAATGVMPQLKVKKPKKASESSEEMPGFVVSESAENAVGGLRGGDAVAYVPISPTMRTLVVLENTDSSDHSVTFVSQPDEWGNVPNADTPATSDMNKTINVEGTASPTHPIITGIWMHNRWAQPATGTVPGYCMVDFGANVADFNIAVIHVPNSSL